MSLKKSLTHHENGLGKPIGSVVNALEFFNLEGMSSVKKLIDSFVFPCWFFYENKELTKRHGILH